MPKNLYYLLIYSACIFVTLLHNTKVVIFNIVVDVEIVGVLHSRRRFLMICKRPENTIIITKKENFK